MRCVVGNNTVQSSRNSVPRMSNEIARLPEIFISMETVVSILHVVVLIEGSNPRWLVAVFI